MEPSPTSRRPTPVDQPNLFDVDDPALDAPVPYSLTVRGRRVVDPTAPTLRVVGGRHDATAPTDAGRDVEGATDPRVQDQRLVEDLGHTHTWRHARARALARSGTSVEDIAADLDLAPTVIRVWLAEPTVPGQLRSHDVTRRSGGPGGATSGPRPGSVAPDDVRGLAILATAGVVEVGAVTASTSRITVAATLVAWLRAAHGVTPGQVRVVLQVADTRTADLVGRAWADRLDLTPDRVTTIPWHGAPTPRAVHATVRVSGRDLAAGLGEALETWPGP